MDNYFQYWIPVRSPKTQRISPSGVLIPVKLYYEKKAESEIDFIDVDKNLLPKEWQKENQLEIDIFLKKFLHLRHVVAGKLKKKSDKNLFRKLNARSKELQAKQEEVIKKHNSSLKQYDELEHLKVNMNDYLGKNKAGKKESFIGEIKIHRTEENGKSNKNLKKRNEVEI